MSAGVFGFKRGKKKYQQKPQKQTNKNSMCLILRVLPPEMQSW